jgi:uncharacterized protein YggE
MPQNPLLSVRGEAVLEVEPEIARIEVSVAARGADRVSTLKLLRERAAAVDKILASFPDAIEKSETSGIRIGPQLSHQASRERVAGYHGAIHQVIAVTGFDQLGELMAQLADQDLTEVGGPWWELRPDSPVYREARAAAARDSVRRARDYASALGSDLAGLVELADARLLAEARAAAEPRAGIAAARLPQRAPAVIPEELGFDLTPARQTVRATVEARFTISPPDLAAVQPA